MIEKKITCDHCQREKGKSNHWWVVNGVKVPAGQMADSLYLMPWKLAGDSEIKDGCHACSRECAHKIIEQWMSQTEGQ